MRKKKIENITHFCRLWKIQNDTTYLRCLFVCVCVSFTAVSFRHFCAFNIGFESKAMWFIFQRHLFVTASNCCRFQTSIWGKHTRTHMPPSSIRIAIFFSFYTLNRSRSFGVKIGIRVSFVRSFFFLFLFVNAQCTQNGFEYLDLIITY